MRRYDDLQLLSRLRCAGDDSGLALLALVAAVPLTGCEQLCSQGAVTWCPRSESDALNDAPRGVEIRARLDVGVDRAGDRLTAVFRR